MSILRSFSFFQLVTDSSKSGLYIINRIVNDRRGLDLFSKNVMESARSSVDLSPRDTEEEFRVLDLKKVTSRQKRQQKKRQQFETRPPRVNQMKEDQDWTSVWPGPRTFHPAVVPLPIRQGHNKKKAPPGKYGNAEIMKIPNFLHLTPPAIEKHCAVLKKFCTQWPKGLETDEKCNEHFPIDVITSDYCHSSPTIRDPLARIVTIKFKLSRLPLDKHAKDKILRLLGDRYDESTDLVTITADRCPLRQQNYEYAMFLLTAVFHESWRIESWEKDKSLDDMEYYEWETNQSYQNVVSLLSKTHPDLDVANLPAKSEMREKLDHYKNAIETIFNNSREAPLNDPYIPRIKVTPEPPLEGKNVSLVCSAYYDIDFILFPKWTLPNPSLLKSERVSVNKVITVTAGDRQGVNTLFLAHATPQDQGDYTCRVIDLLGNTFQKTYKLTLEKDTEEKTSVGLSS